MKHIPIELFLPRHRRQLDIGITSGNAMSSRVQWANPFLLLKFFLPFSECLSDFGDAIANLPMNSA